MSTLVKNTDRSNLQISRQKTVRLRCSKSYNNLAKQHAVSTGDFLCGAWMLDEGYVW